MAEKLPREMSFGRIVASLLFTAVLPSICYVFAHGLLALFLKSCHSLLHSCYFNPAYIEKIPKDLMTESMIASFI